MQLDDRTTTFNTIQQQLAEVNTLGDATVEKMVPHAVK